MNPRAGIPPDRALERHARIGPGGYRGAMRALVDGQTPHSRGTQGSLAPALVRGLAIALSQEGDGERREPREQERQRREDPAAARGPRTASAASAAAV